MQKKTHNGYIDPRLSEIVSLLHEIEHGVKTLQLPKLTQSELNDGLKSSKAGASQPEEVAMTPLFKNALVHYGDMKKDSDYRLGVDSPMTKAEQAIVSNCKLLLHTFNGSSVEYDDSKDVFSVDHYNVQCYQNMKENMRDIQPGQAKQREEMAQLYQTDTFFNFNKVIAMIQKDQLFQKTIVLIMDMIPFVKADDNIIDINLPFMTKHTGVGATFWKNDRTIDPKTNKTYAQVTMDIAESIKDKFDEWYKWNISTMYGRNQRGKGRLLIAVARVLNLLLNPLEAKEIEAYKVKSPLFLGYRDDTELKKGLISIGEYCQKNGLKCANEDYSAFDSTVGAGLLGLVGAISIMKANGSRSKRIALQRAIFAQKTILVDGLAGGTKVIKGRVFSGFIDTNRGGGLCNAIMMTYQCMKQDTTYSKYVYEAPAYMLVMGDDNLHVYKQLDRERLSKDMKNIFGANINQVKYEFGPVFLQYRVFRDPKTQDYVMAYAWTRVVRSMLMKEESKGLGPVGWTWAWYQQLFKLIEYPEAFSIAVNLLIPFDENKFMIDIPIKQQIEMLKKEDTEAMSKAKTQAQKRRVSTTLERLYDGDPSKERFADALNNGDSSIMERIQSMIKKVYDPNFYRKYGLR